MGQHKQENKAKTNPGIHKQFKLLEFSKEEQDILRRLSVEWYLTNSGQVLPLAQSKYRYFLMKPTPVFSEMFNIEREIICVFSNYDRFEPRTIDAFDFAASKHPSLRIENFCMILISNVPNIEEKITKK